MDPELDEIAQLGTGKYHNAARNLHKYVHKRGKTLPIPVSSCRLRIKINRSTAEADVNYPFLKLSSWLQFLLQSCGGEFVLGGYQLHENQHYEPMFERFWERYKTVDSSHPLYSEKEKCQLATTIPFCLHGDEGRTLAKVPLMVESYQPCIPWIGEDELNMLGHLFCKIVV